MKERIKQINQKHEANIFMAKRLYELVENDKITEEYDVEFISKVYSKLNAGFSLSEKQEAYLEKCFHFKY